MNIHEYQAKELFDQFNVPTARGKVASTPDEARTAAAGLAPGAKLVVKSQIHAGGRGKGVFKSGFKGGVKLCDTPDEAAELASQMLGQVLVTHQTGPEGKLVSKVLIAQAVDIAKEYYFAILLDRATSAPVLVASTEGGVNIEEVADHTPEKIIRMSVAPSGGLQPWQARKLARQLGFANKQMLAAAKVFQSLYKLFVTCDCSMVEINPLALTPSGEVLALDAKFGFDESALFRHPDILAMRDVTEEDPREVEASKFGLNYVGLDGSIGCLVNGAGLAMATMDIIKHSGGSPANFLDVGGGATEEQVTQAFGILMADPNVKAILVNIFGGIMRCDVIAQGIINAALKLSLSIPLIVRLEGNRVSEGKALLQSSGLNLIAADHLADAAEKAVAAVNQAA